MDCAEAENEQPLAAVNARAVGAMKPGVKAKKAEVGLPGDEQGKAWNDGGRRTTPRALAGSPGVPRSTSMGATNVRNPGLRKNAIPDGLSLVCSVSGVAGFLAKRPIWASASWLGKRPNPIQGDEYLASVSHRSQYVFAADVEASKLFSHPILLVV